MSRPTVLVVRAGHPSAILARSQLANVCDLQAAPSLAIARQLIRSCRPALVVIDSCSPSAGAADICRVLRGHAEAARLPIVVACDRCSEATRIAGYQSGVDDYLHGRMSSREVRERLLAIVRRIKRPPAPDLNTYIGRHLIADFERVSISVDSSAVELTRREFDLLRVLVEHRNEILTRQELLDAVWYAVSVNDRRTVDVHIRRLRAKLGVAARQIDTLPGRGYRFSEVSPADAGAGEPHGDRPPC